MRTATYPPEQILQPLYEHEVLTLTRLQEHCGCSRMTVWRALHAHGYLSSYSQNGKYYTLADIPRFNALGLWSFEHVRFSRYGSLTQTLTMLVDQSESGYTTDQLAQVVGLPVGPTLSRLHAQARIDRERVGRRFVYVASAPTPRARQIERRQVQHQARIEAVSLPPPERIIPVLVELVRRPELEPQALARRLRRQGVPLSVDEVQAIFARYDLAGKRGR